ncbi:hypothetical protein FXO37_08560 [Capsicum annuum]|nr:hypothetical protein FXO37_08560 [Capsicum annuum]
MMFSLKNRDEVDVFVKHLVDEPIVVDPPKFLENESLENMEESGASFDNRPNFMVGEDHINEENLFTSFSTSPPCTTTPYFTTADSASAPTAAPSVPTSTAAPSVAISTAAPSGAAATSVASPSAAAPSVTTGSAAAPSVTTGSAAAVDDIDVGPAGKRELIGDDDDEEYGLDVHKEVRELRAEQRKFQRRKRKEGVPADNEEVPVGEAGPDLRLHDTETGKVSHEERLGSDEPYFASSDEGSFELDEYDYFGDEEHDVLASGLDNTTDDFIIKNYIPKHTCNKTTRNYLYNANFLAETFRERIIEQPNIKVFNLQELIRKKFKLYVCKTTVRRSRTKVLKDTMGDHAVEFEKILDYKDELLRTNSGTSCVVKLGEASEEARHKTIIIMLEEIRVKLMTRKFNGVTGFEVKEGLCQHKVDIVKRTCSCRVWQLKGIPCAHGVAAILFNKYPLFEYIDRCYSKETYLQTYANVVQPLTNMKMWPISPNIVVAPPEITTLPGRPTKNRKKEVGEIKKSEKLPRTGLAMTCSVCYVRGHNKRGCPHRAPSAEPAAPAVATTTDSGRRRGRPKKTPLEAPNAAPQGKSNDSGRGRGRPKKTSSEAITEPPQVKKERGKLKRTISVGATATPLRTALPVPTILPASSSAPSNFCTSSLIAGTTKRGMDSGSGNTAPFKRQRVVGMGVFQAENGFKVLNPGMPSSKIYSTGQAKVARSGGVTSDIGYTPSSTSKLKWNDKSAISTRKLQELKENRRKKKVKSKSNHPSQNTASSKSNMPGKL